MADFIVNGQTQSFDEDAINIVRLLELLKIESRWVAVEVNREIIDRADFGTMVIKDADVVEIVLPIGGG